MPSLKILALAAMVAAGPLYITRDQNTNCPGTACSTATGLNNAQYTGWTEVSNFADITFELTFTDANDSVTALTTVCWTDDTNSGANGTGFEVCSVGVASGTGTRTCPYTDSLTTGTAEKFTQTWTNLPHQYINCLYTATGTPAAADTLLIDVRRKTP